MRRAGVQSTLQAYIFSSHFFLGGERANSPPTFEMAIYIFQKKGMAFLALKSFRHNLSFFAAFFSTR
jgi:hypothetical protein